MGPGSSSALGRPADARSSGKASRGDVHRAVPRSEPALSDTSAPIGQVEQADISVVFATYRRADLLEKTLEAFTSVIADTLRWQLVVVDNADDIASQEVLRRYETRLPLTWLVERRTGKNRALNAALPLLRGDIFVFTDDDVLPETRWLEELLSAAKRWPEHAIFGGRIVPDRPIPFDTSEPMIRSAYVISDEYPSDTEVRAGRIWGPNLAIRAAAFRARAVAFDETIGPAGSSYAMGSETELLLRLQALGERCMFVPAAVVRHQIRPEQVSLRWLRERCFRAGRGHARRYPASNGLWLSVPRYLVRTAVTGWVKRQLAALFLSRDDYVRISLEHSFVLGQIAEYFSNPRS
jgi:GT2 family glycosyltransferase